MTSCSRSPSPQLSGSVSAPVQPVQPEPKYDEDELLFGIDQIQDKVYVMQGSGAYMCLEWQDLDASVFWRKQGYNNAKKFTHKQHETTVVFLNRAVNFQKLAVQVYIYHPAITLKKKKKST